MPWILILLVILMAGACSVIIVLSLRASYRTLLSDIDSTVTKIHEITSLRLDIYDRMHGLLFFFAGDSLPPKKEFSIPQDAAAQELYDLNVLIDTELSLLIDTASQNEELRKQRGVTIRNTEAELEKLESELTTSILFFNDRIRTSKRYKHFILSGYFLSGIEQLEYREIIFHE